jgi:cyclopropane fatty-acyl-phospholipid synthase-like methyltransferase
MRNCFVGNTVDEVDFLIEELGLEPGSAVLDIGCGTGRHCVELARRGYRATGVDLSPGMLAEARGAADAAGVQVEWIQCDAPRFQPAKAYDAVICLCEGAFGLLGRTDDAIEHPLAILRSIRAALKPGGKSLLTVLNACRTIRGATQKDVQEGRFDPLTLVETGEMVPAEGHAAIPTRERAFVATELRLLARCAGLEVLRIWGGTAGAWNRAPIDLDEYELMVVAQKPGA